MVKRITAAAWGLSLALLLTMGAAYGQAASGHRQPAANDVPANDSVRGDPDLAGKSGAAGKSGVTGKSSLAGKSNLAGPTRKKRSRSGRVQSNIDVIMKTPNICSNCNQ
jgi:hypothetical protein